LKKDVSLVGSPPLDPPMRIRDVELKCTMQWD
jgi:hypothetical protein